MIKTALIVSLTLVSVWMYQNRVAADSHARRLRKHPEVRHVEGKARTALAKALQEAHDATKAGASK